MADYSFDFEEYFSNRLAKLRIDRGVSAREMSIAIGQSHSYIYALENKKNLPSMQIFFYICSYLDVTPKEFFDSDTSAPNEVNELLKSIEGLDKDQIHSLTTAINALRKK